MENEYLVKKWLSNELSEAEEASFKAMDDAKLYEEIIQEAQRFNGNTQAKVASFEELDRLLSTQKKVISLSWMKIVSSIAAILVAGFAVFSILDNGNINAFETNYAQNEIITLPDNSIVNLNEHSQLSFDASTWNDERTLDLNGEAFFDVEKGKRFQVKTNRGIVSVLGTEFNVIATDSLFKVSCYEGLVQVNYNNEEIKLPAGTEFTLKLGNAKKTEITIAEPSWIKNMSVFENASLSAVFKEFEKQYGVTVNFDPSIQLHFTGAFEHNNLENALNSITQPLNLTFVIKNNNQVIIGNAHKE
ncbi:MAG: FecR family protein [Winogradskyella sp.]|uniref:FecR family protein n=1 Tax=Winogradskyella sp. TaxID=1883156 RepID=UPI00385F48B8